MPEGTDIKGTERFTADIEQQLLKQAEEQHSGLKHLTTVIGQGAQRFVLPYQPEKGYPAYAQLIIEMADLASLKVYMPELETFLNQRFPQAQFRLKNMENGPSPPRRLRLASTVMIPKYCVL